MSPTEFGIQLKSVRRSRGTSQRDLSVQAGLSKSTVGQLEGGQRKNPGLETVEKLAAALGATQEEFGALLRSAGHRSAAEHLYDPKRPSVRMVVSRDPDLTKDQRDLLLGVYDDMISRNRGQR